VIVLALSERSERLPCGRHRRDAQAEVGVCRECRIALLRYGGLASSLLDSDTRIVEEDTARCSAEKVKACMRPSRKASVFCLRKHTVRSYRRCAAVGARRRRRGALSCVPPAFRLSISACHVCAFTESRCALMINFLATGSSHALLYHFHNSMKQLKFPAQYVLRIHG